MSRRVSVTTFTAGAALSIGALVFLGVVAHGGGSMAKALSLGKGVGPNLDDPPAVEIMFVPSDPNVPLDRPGSVTYESAEPTVFYRLGNPSLTGHHNGACFMYWPKDLVPWIALSDRPEIQAQAAALAAINNLDQFSITYEWGYYNEQGQWTSLIDSLGRAIIYPCLTEISDVDTFSCIHDPLLFIRLRLIVSWSESINGLTQLPAQIPGTWKWEPADPEERGGA